jgi:hypothetical protein
VTDDDYTEADAKAEWELEKLFRRFGEHTMREAIAARREKKSSGRPPLTSDIPHLAAMARLMADRRTKRWSAACEVAETIRGYPGTRDRRDSIATRLERKFKEAVQKYKWEQEKHLLMQTLGLKVIHCKIQKARESLASAANTDAVLAELDTLEDQLLTVCTKITQAKATLDAEFRTEIMQAAAVFHHCMNIISARD